MADLIPSSRVECRGMRIKLTSPLPLFTLLSLALAGSGVTMACQHSEENKPSSSANASVGVGPSANADGGAALLAAPTPEERATTKIVAFSSDKDVADFMHEWTVKEERAKTPALYPMNGSFEGGTPPAATSDDYAPSKQPSPAPAAAAPPAPRAAAHAAAEAKSAKDSRSESITNNQHADVDEGDIVKLHGDQLVVLRRGRLFTISLAGDKIQKSAMSDAFGPDIDPSGSWYDEMLVDGDTVVVIGFSYARGGTEIGLFHIEPNGGLRYRSTYHMRSNDYYSARNYASRMVGGRLVFYTPTYLTMRDNDVVGKFPAVRRWHKGARDDEFVRTLSATHLYRMQDEEPESGYFAMHTVTSCELHDADMKCESVGLLGPPGRVFYVSDSNVYVWMRDWSRAIGQSPVLAKIPLQANPTVTAMRVSGMPTDQFSFEEADGALNVLVRSESDGDAMWASGSTGGDAALMRVPLSLFSDGVPVAAASRYRRMPRPDGYSVQNRFVGPWLLYGAGNSYWGQRPGQGQLYAVKYASREEPETIIIAQGVDRIEAMGDNAVVVGSKDSDLVFTPVELAGEVHARRDFVRKNAAQSESRSHGFFYKHTTGNDGIVGLPIVDEDGAKSGRYRNEGSASVIFLANHSLDFSDIGSLKASPLLTNHDGCRASCIDWYGNARPIFVKDRVFALMGYELVEGKLDGKRLAERNRLSFAPLGGAPAEDDGY